MTIQDLRIGNCLYSDDEVMYVTGIPTYNTNVIMCKNIDDIHSEYELILNTDLKEILINHKLLLDLGFRKGDSEEDYDELEQNYYYGEGRKRLAVGSCTELSDGDLFDIIHNGIILFRSDVGMGYTDLSSEIKYVHQLQNLYHSLTGEELTLKN